MDIDKVKILIIEDNWLEAEFLRDLFFTEMNTLGQQTTIQTASREKEAYELLSNNVYDVVVFDIDLDRRGAGLELLKTFSKSVEFSIISTSREADEIVEKGYEYGCEHFLSKPVRKEKIAHVITDFLQKTEKQRFFYTIKSKFITKDEETLNQISKILNFGEAPIHIQGPTGVGKQVLAQLIDEWHNGSQSGLYDQNCAAINESLAESQFFGHKKGAFTGADQDQKGIFELAHQKIVFLDEIDKLSKPIQAKILKAIEQKKIRPVGSEREISVDFKLITASSQDIEELVEKGEFLPDLWERLQGEVIRIKPLCERPSDIEHQLKHFIREHKSGRLFIFSDKAMNMLKEYHWPGNTRELKGVVDKLQRRKLKVVQVDDLKFLRSKRIKGKYSFISPHIIKSVEEDGLKSTIDKLTGEVIDYYLKQNFNNIRKTMRDLDISSSRFYKHIPKREERL